MKFPIDIRKPSKRNRLLSYSAAATALFSVHTDVSAQTILYQNPDIPFTGDFYLDLDGDSIADAKRNTFFNFSSTSGYWWSTCSVYMEGTGMPGTGFVGFQSYSPAFVAALREFDSIGPAVTQWYSYSNNHPSTQWNPDSVYYIGFKKVKTGGEFYGWIRAKYFDCKTWALFDFAINTVPGQPILAGQYCEPPELLWETVFGVNVTLEWSMFDQATHYTIEYRPVGAGAWTVTTTTALTYFISGLAASTTYEWRVTSHCGTDVDSQPSAVQTFTTSLPLPSGPKPKPRHTDTH